MTVVAMTEHTGPGAENLTGVWQGLYSYPHGQSVSFVATLIDSGASFSGTVHEPCILGNSPNKTLYAALDGTRQGSAVSFLKTYQDAGPNYGSVHYNGALNDDGTEIEGRWRIQGVWSGKFLMIRSAGKVAEVERKVSERI
jgi:hypothetical protein